MTATKFKLGQRLRDKLTGIEGFAISYVFHLSGCQHIEIEPDATEGKRAEIVYLPEERFTLVSQPEDTKQPDISTCHVKLGNKVKDSLTGFDGHATMIMIPLHGVGRVAIEPTKIKDGKLADPVFFDEQRVEVISPKAPPEAPAMPETRKERGCSPTSAAGMSGRTR